MADVLLLDLGDTLVHDNSPLPHVPEALAALRKFTGTSGAPLQLALVSDFLPADPPTAAGIKARFGEYLALLDGFGLRRFFSPVTRRITLSTHGGVTKPDRRVYELALQRLGTGAGLADCLSITEDASHVAACRALGMAALRFGSDFADWADGPLLVRHVVDPANAPNTKAALGVWFAARHGRKLAALVGTPTAAGVRVRLKPPGPTTASVTFDAAGRVAAVDFAAAIAATAGAAAAEDQDDEEVEARLFERSLREHGQVAPAGQGPLPPGATHRVERDARGKPVVKRGRFSAF